MSPKSKQSKMLLISIFLLRTTARLIDSIAFSFARFKVSVSSSLLPTFYFRIAPHVMITLIMNDLLNDFSKTICLWIFGDSGLSREFQEPRQPQDSPRQPRTGPRHFQDVPRQAQDKAKTGPRQPTTSSQWSLYQPPVPSCKPRHRPARPGSRSE